MSYRPEYVAQVPLSTSLGAQSLEASYGGRVLSENRETGYALMGFSGTEASSGHLSNQVLPPLHLERNRDAFRGGGLTATMGARRMVWVNGEFSAWAGARRMVWVNGTFDLIPQNTFSFQQIGLEAAQAQATNLGAGVKVAVIDTGVDIDHPAFTGSLAPQSEWRDFWGNDNNPDEEGTLGTGGYGHGTAVAGIVLQVAPKATILPLRVLGPDGSGDVAQVAQAIDWAVKCNARIINLSLGSEDRSNIVRDAIARAAAQGVVVVASGGNDNRETLTYPANDATAKGMGETSLSVGSVDGMDRKSSFSNYAKALEVMAPGEDIYTPGPDNLLVSWSGTSMSAPMVAGGVALAIGQKPSLAAKDITAKLKDAAFDIYKDGLNSEYKGRLGKGRLDLPSYLSKLK